MTKSSFWVRFSTLHVLSTRLVPTCQHLIVFSFFYKGICLEDLVVCDYRPHGTARSGNLLFARRSRAAGEIRFHYRDQLRVADLIVSEASYFEPLVRRAASLGSGRALLTSDDDRVLRAFLDPRSVVPTVLGLQELLRPLGDTFLPRHLHVLAGGVAAMVAAGVVQLVAYVRPHQVPASSPAPTPTASGRPEAPTPVATTKKRPSETLSAQDARSLKRAATLANAREAKARSQLGEEREVSAELREALGEKEALLEALRVDAAAERAKLVRSARDLKQQRQAWRLSKWLARATCGNSSSRSRGFSRKRFPFRLSFATPACPPKSPCPRWLETSRTACAS